MSARAGQWDSDAIEELLDDDGDGDDGSATIKSLRAALRASNKRAKEMQTELDGVRTTSRQTTLADLLKDRNLDPKVAKFFPKDADATEEAVDKWLEEDGDIFAKTSGQQQTERDGLDPEDIGKMRQMDVLAGNASPAETNDALRSLQGAESKEELIALIQGGARV